LVVTGERTGRVEAWRGRNTAKEPAENFRLDPDVMIRAKAEGRRIIAVYHSHLAHQTDQPSLADKVGAEQVGYPYLIFHLGLQRFVWHHPRGFRAPLVGRPFIHGTLDCYELVRDWYAENRQLHLPHFDREDDWWLKGQDLYVQNFAACGFQPIALREARRGDAFLFALQSPVPNHAAVYLGDGLIIHHPPGCLSCAHPWVHDRGFYAQRVRLALRHVDASP